MKTYCIYVLTEGGRRVRYIGITIQRQEKRLLQHYADATRSRTDHKTNWIRNRLAEGVAIDIHVVRQWLSKSRAEQLEVGLLRLFRKAFGLVNSHKGGSTGYSGLSSESKAQHKESGIARYADKTHRKRSNQRNREAQRIRRCEDGLVELEKEIAQSAAFLQPKKSS